ncbi:C1q-like domain-containing protein [Paenibacillus lautus]|uniref:C1q-like domain-containing protein n=1 Tax=Paenibacillus lautus TaxID=1401 RepID=UPI001C7C9E1F|nr:hypothetical protein [Paenibacillus lautus]
MGGLPTTKDSQRSTIIKNVNINGNVFKTNYRFSIINGDLSGSIDSLNITNNVIEIGNQEVLFYLLGNINHLNFSGNSVETKKSIFSQGGYFDFSKNYENNSAFFPTTTGSIIVHNNSFKGRVQSIIYDDSDKSENSLSAIKWNLDLLGNTMISQDNKIPVNTKGTYNNTIKTSCRIRNTYCIGGSRGINSFGGTLEDDCDIPFVETTLSTHQTLESGVLTKLLFDKVNHDNRENYNTNTSQFVSSIAGLYQVQVSLVFSDHQSVDSVLVTLNKNGNEQTLLIHSSLNLISDYMLSGMKTIELQKGDVIDIWIKTSGSVKINDVSYLQIRMT